MVSLIGLWTTRPWCGKLHEYRGQSFFYFVRIAVPLVIIISIRAVFLRIWRHLLQFSTIETRKINCSAKFSEIKDQKTCALYFVIDWNLARYLGKTYCVQKCKKNGHREFGHRGTLNIGVFQWKSQSRVKVSHLVSGNSRVSWWSTLIVIKND